MDNMIYDLLCKYFNALSVKGYMSPSYANKLLVLIFYRDFIFHEYNDVLSHEDYLLIERALDCLYGTDCLIPYPDYMKTGSLNLGQLSEIRYRLKALENESVMKVIHNLNDAEDDLDSDVLIYAEDD